MGKPQLLISQFTLLKDQGISLKKSLVFYKGRAAEGIKTDSLMHEFRIFKKANSIAHIALSHSWVSPTVPENTTSDHFLTSSHFTNYSNEISLINKTSPPIQFSGFSINE